jgi:hypothetical protein
VPVGWAVFPAHPALRRSCRGPVQSKLSTLKPPAKKEAWSPDSRAVLFDRAAPLGGDLWLLEGVE